MHGEEGRRIFQDDEITTIGGGRACVELLGFGEGMCNKFLQGIFHEDASELGKEDFDLWRMDN